MQLRSNYLFYADNNGVCVEIDFDKTRFNHFLD